MREIQVSDAKARLPQILDDVERGETVVITRRGRPIARIVPEPPRCQEEIDKAIADIRALRARIGSVATEELLPSRHEGHRL
jgi:prevent-host-death family protein